MRPNTGGSGHSKRKGVRCQTCRRPGHDSRVCKFFAALADGSAGQERVIHLAFMPLGERFTRTHAWSPGLRLCLVEGEPECVETDPEIAEPPPPRRDAEEIEHDERVAAQRQEASERLESSRRALAEHLAAKRGREDGAIQRLLENDPAKRRRVAPSSAAAAAAAAASEVSE